MLLMRANVYRLELTDEQSRAFAQWAGACRFVYNCGLEQRRDWYRHTKLSYVQQCRELTDCRAAFDWLAAVPVHVLQQALRDLDIAYQKFFSGVCGYPRPRQKDDGHGFRFPDRNCLDFKRLSKRMGAIKVPKLGWIKCRNWRPLVGDLRNVTIRRKAGHWYASIQWQITVPDPIPKNSPMIGVDRGVAVFAAMSDGNKIKPLNSFWRIEARLAKHQRRLARKKTFSANWRKLRTKISRLHSHAANARKDFLHKLSTDIAKSHGVVKVEKLHVRGMTASAAGTVENPGRNVAQKRGLNKAILDQGWSMFRDMLRYKLAERGGILVQVPAAYTSQTCSCCGIVDKKGRKNQETFECAHCGHAENADVNAARNILQVKTLAVEPPKRTLRRVGKRKQLNEISL